MAEIEGADFMVIWATPILPGKAEAWRRFLQAMLGERRQAYEETCRRFGIIAMRGWVAETAQADIGVIAVIASHPEQVMVWLAETDLPFERWFRAHLATLQGVDLSQSPRLPSSDLVLDWWESKEGGETAS